MGWQVTFCPTCDRLFDNYSACVARGDGWGALAALEEYDIHRDERAHAAKKVRT